MVGRGERNSAPDRQQREPRLVPCVIAFADVVGSTALADAHELDAFRAMRRVLEMLRRNARALGGRVVYEAGDGALASFSCACEAVQWAAWCHKGAARIALSKRNGSALLLRVGIHCGRVLVYGTRIFGRNVVVACRLQQAARPGETLISGAALELLAGHATGRASAAGEIPLKGTPTCVAAFRMDNSWPTRSGLDALVTGCPGGAIAELAVA